MRIEAVNGLLYSDNSDREQISSYGEEKLAKFAGKHTFLKCW